MEIKAERIQGTDEVIISKNGVSVCRCDIREAGEIMDMLAWCSKNESKHSEQFDELPVTP